MCTIILSIYSFEIKVMFFSLVGPTKKQFFIYNYSLCNFTPQLCFQNFYRFLIFYYYKTKVIKNNFLEKIDYK